MIRRKEIYPSQVHGHTSVIAESDGYTVPLKRLLLQLVHGERTVLYYVQSADSNLLDSWWKDIEETDDLKKAVEIYNRT